jgi:RimJ/RimL family protein N-acetyltransferase
LAAQEIITHLEMTSVEQLRAARPVPVVLLDPVEHASPLVRSTQARIGAPHSWPSMAWSEGQWQAWLAHPERRQWIVRCDGVVAGLAELESQPGGEVELTTFGLVPEFVGRGFGGYALTLAAQLAWGLDPVQASQVRRVWLQTSSLDHPNALPNYRSRGFRPFRTEVRDLPAPC